MPARVVFIGYDSREMAAYAVCKETVKKNFDGPVFPIVLGDCIDQGLYWRPTEKRGEQLWDQISDAPMSTEFANSRFLVPYLTKKYTKLQRTPASWPGLIYWINGDSAMEKEGWALFMDCDMLVMSDLNKLFSMVEQHPDKALFCVKHNHDPQNAFKMDGQLQTKYNRKNWSSVMLFNLDHPSNKKLTLELINGVPGRDLHRFCWLEDDEIGELGSEWNHLVGVSESNKTPSIVHFTNGGPWFPQFRDVPYSTDWLATLLF